MSAGMHILGDTRMVVDILPNPAALGDHQLM